MPISDNQLYKLGRKLNNSKDLLGVAYAVEMAGEDVFKELLKKQDTVHAQKALTKDIVKSAARLEKEEKEAKKKSSGYVRKEPLTEEEIARREAQKAEIRRLQKLKKEEKKQSKSTEQPKTKTANAKPKVVLQTWTPPKKEDIPETVVEEVVSEEIVVATESNDEVISSSEELMKLLTEDILSVVKKVDKPSEVKETPLVVELPDKKDHEIKPIEPTQTLEEMASELKRQGKAVTTLKETENKFLITNGRFYVRKSLNYESTGVLETTNARNSAWWITGKERAQGILEKKWKEYGYHVEPVGAFAKVRDKRNKDMTATKVVPLDQVKNPEEILYEREKISNRQKRVIWDHAGQRCEICGKRITFGEASVDHIDSLVMGGSNTRDNYQCTCYTCNQIIKGGMTMDGLKKYLVNVVENLSIFDKDFKENIKKAVNK